MKRIAILASGSGSNAENIANYFKGSDYAEVSFIIANNPQAYVIERAKRLGIECAVVTKAQFIEADTIIAMLKERLEAMAKRKEELEKEVLKKRDEKPRYMRELLEKCERALMKIGILEQKATDSEARRAKLLDDMHNLEETQNQLWKIVVKLSETIDELQAVVEEKTQREQEASARRIALEAELARKYQVLFQILQVVDSYVDCVNRQNSARARGHGNHGAGGKNAVAVFVVLAL